MADHDHGRKHLAHRQLTERLARQAEDVRRFTSGLDEQALSNRIVPDKWSLKELVCHLWRIQDLFEDRIRAMLDEDNPAIAPYEPEGDPEFDRRIALPTADSLTRFLEGRERLVARLDQLSPAEWHRAGRHPEYPAYDIHFQVDYMLFHEAHHLYQMLQRRALIGRLPH